MLILLPPSETKRDGGAGAPLDFGALSYPRLGRVRRSLVRRVVQLARQPEEMLSRLKLGPKLAFEVERNRRLRTTPTMPALDRYTGVLYEALDAPALDADARAFADGHLAIHSALFGLVAACDGIPAYRLSHDSRLEGPTLRATWGSTITRELGSHRDELILDLRSEGYTALGPTPAGRSSYFVRVVTPGDDGRQRALNHFNKKGKGELTRALLQNGEDFADAADLIAWGAQAGFALEVAENGELLLEV
jgi:cytoplasmic iron level regulating protein YaaA (DUF328/UPF0246 family)